MGKKRIFLVGGKDDDSDSAKRTRTRAASNLALKPRPHGDYPRKNRERLIQTIKALEAHLEGNPRDTLSMNRLMKLQAELSQYQGR